MPSASLRRWGRLARGGRNAIAFSNARRPPAIRWNPGSASRGSWRISGSGRTPARRQNGTCNLQLRQLRAARQLLYRGAIRIPRREVQVGEVAAAAQRIVHQAYALEHLGPVDFGDEPHAGDDVADRHIGLGLLLVIALNHLVGGGALQRQALLEPRQHARRLDVLHREGAARAGPRKHRAKAHARIPSGSGGHAPPRQHPRREAVPPGRPPPGA